MDLRLKRVAHLTGIPRKLDYRFSGRDFDSMESVPRQPVRDRLNIRVGGAKLRAELLRGQPFVEIRGTFVLLLGH